MLLAYFLYFIAAAALSVIFTLAVKKIALKKGIVDIPGDRRKTHKAPVPLLGGTAIFASFWLVVFFLFLNPVYGIEIFRGKVLGVFLAGAILIVMGIVDDIKQLSPKLRLMITAIAALVAILFGMGLDKITNPFGGAINLKNVFILADLLVFVWLMGMMYTTKILDGLDGLVTGIAVIGAFMIFFLTNTVKYFQPNVALLAAIFAGSCVGFLVFNFYPAKIFLGEGGSLFLGFILGVLAIIGGGKLATALLVMAIPILDLIRVMIVRISKGRSIFKGDREHLHFRLVDSGFSHRQAVILLYAMATIFGITTLFLQSSQKLAALGLLVILMIIINIWLAKRETPAQSTKTGA